GGGGGGGGGGAGGGGGGGKGRRAGRGEDGAARRRRPARGRPPANLHPHRRRLPLRARSRRPGPLARLSALASAHHPAAGRSARQLPPAGSLPLFPIPGPAAGGMVLLIRQHFLGS